MWLLHHIVVSRAATKMSLLPRVSFSKFLLGLPVGSVVNKESYLGKMSWLLIQATPVLEYHILQFLEIDFAIIQEFEEYSRTLGFQQQSETKCNIVLTSTANAEDAICVQVVTLKVFLAMIFIIYVVVDLVLFRESDEWMMSKFYNYDKYNGDEVKAKKALHGNK